MVLEMCYKTLYNAMTRREHERNENRRMIEKQQRIKSLTINMREQGATPEQLAEVRNSKTNCQLVIRLEIVTLILFSFQICS